VKGAIDHFLKKQSNTFTQDSFHLFKDNLKQLYNEKFSKIKEFQINYDKQIQDIEFLINKKNDSQQCHLDDILNSLTKEKYEEIVKVECVYDKLTEVKYEASFNGHVSSERIVISDILYSSLIHQITNVFNTKK